MSMLVAFFTLTVSCFEDKFPFFAPSVLFIRSKWLFFSMVRALVGIHEQMETVSLQHVSSVSSPEWNCWCGITSHLEQGKARSVEFLHQGSSFFGLCVLVVSHFNQTRGFLNKWLRLKSWQRTVFTSEWPDNKDVDLCFFFFDNVTYVVWTSISLPDFSWVFSRFHTFCGTRTVSAILSWKYNSIGDFNVIIPVCTALRSSNF